jgi:hypothetical protein
MSLDLCLLIFNQQQLIKLELGIINAYIIHPNLFRLIKMLQIIMLEEIIQLVKISLMFAWIESEN